MVSCSAQQLLTMKLEFTKKSKTQILSSILNLNRAKNSIGQILIRVKTGYLIANAGQI